MTPDHVDHHHPHDEGDHHHPHPGAAEVLPEPSGPGSVVLDLGAGIGAAVVRTPEHLDGDEIEIRPETGEWEGKHVAVRPRPLPDRTLYAAVFEGLPAGAYRVRVRFGPPDAVEVPFEVTSAHVTDVAWPGL